MRAIVTGTGSIATRHLSAICANCFRMRRLPW